MDSASLVLDSAVGLEGDVRVGGFRDDGYELGGRGRVGLAGWVVFLLFRVFFVLCVSGFLYLFMGDFYREFLGLFIGGLLVLE